MTNLGSVKFVFIFETHFDIISPLNTEFLLSDHKTYNPFECSKCLKKTRFSM